MRGTQPTLLQTYLGATEQGWLAKYEREALFVHCFSAQVLHWQEVCPDGAVHDDGKDCAKVQDGTGWTPTWRHYQLRLRPR